MKVTKNKMENLGIDVSLLGFGCMRLIKVAGIR